MRRVSTVLASFFLVFYYDLELAEVRFTPGPIQGPFPPCTRKESDRLLNLLLGARHKERARIAPELHDTLFQDFFGASRVLQSAPANMPANSPRKSPLNHALQLMRRAIAEGRLAFQGLRSPETTPTSLEKALADFGNEFTPDGARFQIFVLGRPKALRPTIQEQIYLIGREAIANAFNHSKAASIEVEVVYLPGELVVVIRDNGCGIGPQAVWLPQNVHRGLSGMYERARNIGAHLDIWSRRGSGTQVEISISSDLATETRTWLEV